MYSQWLLLHYNMEETTWIVKLKIFSISLQRKFSHPVLEFGGGRWGGQGKGAGGGNGKSYPNPLCLSNSRNLSSSPSSLLEGFTPPLPLRKEGSHMAVALSSELLYKSSLYFLALNSFIPLM